MDSNLDLGQGTIGGELSGIQEPRYDGRLNRPMKGSRQERSGPLSFCRAFRSFVSIGRAAVVSKCYEV